MALFFLSLVLEGKSVIVSFILPLSESFRDVEIALLILIILFTSKKYHSPQNSIDTHLSFSLESPEKKVSLFNLSHYTGSAPFTTVAQVPLYVAAHIYIRVCVYPQVTSECFKNRDNTFYKA